MISVMAEISGDKGQMSRSRSSWLVGLIGRDNVSELPGTSCRHCGRHRLRHKWRHYYRDLIVLRCRGGPQIGQRHNYRHRWPIVIIWWLWTSSVSRDSPSSSPVSSVSDSTAKEWQCWTGLPLTSSFLLEYSYEFLNEYSSTRSYRKYFNTSYQWRKSDGAGQHTWGSPKGQGLEQAWFNLRADLC